MKTVVKKERIEKLIEHGKSFIDKGLTFEDPNFEAWKAAVIRVIEQIYGNDSTDSKRFKKRIYSPGIFYDGMDENLFFSTFNKGMNETIADLELILDEFDDNILTSDKNHEKTNYTNPINLNINNNNSNSNNNSNNNSLNTIPVMEINKIKRVIEDNSFLDEKSKKELLLKLEEIDEIKKSKDPKSKKWSKAKEILRFLLDKGADIVIMYLPQIIQSIS